MTADTCALTDLPPAMCAHCRGLDDIPVQRGLLTVYGSGFPARFDTVCPVCRLDILVGDSILAADMPGGYHSHVHAECVE